MNPTVLRAVLLAPTKPPAALTSLFSNGQKGDVWLPHFSKYAFQDAAMTIPAVVGMPVVKMAGAVNGVVATFANVTLQQDANGKKYLAANGSTSSGSTAAIDFSGTDKMTVIAGVHKASDAASGVICELSADINANNGAFTMLGPRVAGAAEYGVRAKGTTSSNVSTASSYAAARTDVLTFQADIAGDLTSLRVSGVSAISDATDLGTGNFGNHPLYLLARGGASVFLNGRFYGAVVCGAALAAGQIADAERVIAGYSGVNI